MIGVVVFLSLSSLPLLSSGVASPTTTLTVTTPVTEVAALADFFFSTNGPQWRIKYGWEQFETTVDISTLNPCQKPFSWYIITHVFVPTLSFKKKEEEEALVYFF
jgi:hypothetical protein